MGLYSGGRIYKAACIWNVDYIRTDWKRGGWGVGLYTGGILWYIMM